MTRVNIAKIQEICKNIKEEITLNRWEYNNVLIDTLICCVTDVHFHISESLGKRLKKVESKLELLSTLNSNLVLWQLESEFETFFPHFISPKQINLLYFIASERRDDFPDTENVKRE